MAALNEGRRHDDGEKTGVAQQGAGPMVDIYKRFWRAQRLKAEADEGAKRCHRCDDPDQVFGSDDIDQQPASQRACHERCRAPQPQRSVIEAMARHASQGIGIGQRHHRRPQAAGDGVGEKYQHRLMLGAENGKPERRRKGRYHDSAAERMAPFGESGHKGQNGEARHRRDRRDDPDPESIDPDRLQPNREKRQMGAHHTEHRAVK